MVRQEAEGNMHVLLQSWLGLQIASDSLDALFDTNPSSCRQERSWPEIVESRSREMDSRYVTGGLRKLTIFYEYQVGSVTTETLARR